jgi:hypothetical protein
VLGADWLLAECPDLERSSGIERRRFLSALISILGNRSFMKGGAGIFASFSTLRSGRAGWTSGAIVDGLLGEVVEAGSTSRLCIFGQRLTGVKDILFDTPDVEVRSLSVTGSEIIADISASACLEAGAQMFFLKMESGSICNGGRVLVTAFAKSAYCPDEPSCIPVTPGWPKSPGWPKQQSGSPEQYYEERVISSGLGGALL